MTPALRPPSTDADCAIAPPLRILHVVPSYLPAVRYGGPIYSVHGLCKALAARGHAVEVFTTNVDGPGLSDVPVGAPVDMDGVGVWYFACGAGRRLYRSPAMGAALRARVATFDVVHMHSVFLWPTLAAARAAAAAGVPYVVAPRGMLVGDLITRKSRALKSAWIALFERRTLAGAAALHMTSAIECAEYRNLGLPVRRMVEIPNGIDPPPATTAPSRPRGGRPIVLFLGRLSWKKGLDRLVPAMAYVPEAELVIAGNDDEGYTATIERLAREAGVADRVRLVGQVQGQDKWDLMRSATVFALASHSENFGNTVLEAMACGVPVVVTPEVGLAEEVAMCGAGIVVEGEARTFGEAIAGLIRDEPRRSALGTAGAVAAQDRFSWAAVGKATERLYRDLAQT